MRLPLAGSRSTARRLAEGVWRRLEPGDDESQEAAARFEDDEAVAAASSPPGPPDAAARIDAARARLRATIAPPSDDADR